MLDLVTFTLKEVRRLNPALATEELTVENAMSKSFHKILQRELDPVWHQLSGKVRKEEEIDKLKANVNSTFSPGSL